MTDLILKGERYRATFQNSQKEGDHSTHVYTCWNTSPHMWWKGRVRIEDRSSGKDVRAFFESYHRSDVPEGIKDENLEESLLLVRGRNEKGNLISHKNGGKIITNRQEVIDYLLGRMYQDALDLGRDEVFPTINVPLLEQHELAERGYALGEPISV